MKTEELKKLGLDTSQAKSVLAMNGRDIEHAKETVRQKLEEQKGKEPEKEPELDRSADADALQKEAAYWKEQFYLAQEKARADAAKVSLKLQAHEVYRRYGAKDDEVIDALVDWEKVTAEDEKPVGLEQQVKLLAKRYPYLFEDENPLPSFSAESGKSDGGSTCSAIRRAMGLS